MVKLARQSLTTSRAFRRSHVPNGQQDCEQSPCPPLSRLGIRLQLTTLPPATTAVDASMEGNALLQEQLRIIQQYAMGQGSPSGSRNTPLDGSAVSLPDIRLEGSSMASISEAARTVDAADVVLSEVPAAAGAGGDPRGALQQQVLVAAANLVRKSITRASMNAGINRRSMRNGTDAAGGSGAATGHESPAGAPVMAGSWWGGQPGVTRTPERTPEGSRHGPSADLQALLKAQLSQALGGIQPAPELERDTSKLELDKKIQEGGTFSYSPREMSRGSGLGEVRSAYASEIQLVGGPGAPPSSSEMPPQGRPAGGTGSSRTKVPSKLSSSSSNPQGPASEEARAARTALGGRDHTMRELSIGAALLSELPAPGPAVGSDLTFDAQPPAELKEEEEEEGEAQPSND